MADNWQVGDLALCVGNPIASTARKGGIYRVLQVVGPLRYRGATCRGLVLEGVEHREAYLCWGLHACAELGFRKIRPHTPDAEDAETIRLLTGKPAKVPA